MFQVRDSFLKIVAVLIRLARLLSLTVHILKGHTYARVRSSFQSSTRLKSHVVGNTVPLGINIISDDKSV